MTVTMTAVILHLPLGGSEDIQGQSGQAMVEGHTAGCGSRTRPRTWSRCIHMCTCMCTHKASAGCFPLLLVTLFV